MWFMNNTYVYIYNIFPVAVLKVMSTHSPSSSLRRSYHNRSFYFYHNPNYCSTYIPRSNDYPNSNYFKDKVKDHTLRAFEDAIAGRTDSSSALQRLDDVLRPHLAAHLPPALLERTENDVCILFHHFFCFSFSFSFSFSLTHCFDDDDLFKYSHWEIAWSK